MQPKGISAVNGPTVRFALSLAAGGLVWAFCAANLGEVGMIAGAVFGLAAGYLSYEYLTRRAEERLTREKWKDYE